MTIATEFAAKARGAAMSLVAFCFMGGGGVGTAIGGRMIERLGYTGLFAVLVAVVGSVARFRRARSRSQA